MPNISLEYLNDFKEIKKIKTTLFNGLKILLAMVFYRTNYSLFKNQSVIFFIYSTGGSCPTLYSINSFWSMGIKSNNS